ncbi:predicted protein [Sclerotinia sclerotiorum 1980 UF-70]|uniref:Uncharacterized protein n=1 Tax=Sclerotinia sclerotiorum (strain ATCC 18683 / 1980 / Ss-1) TaxID=665079 RepID=A7F3D6_SCLS1|nr:predicted protein [Sclerotinia sclerotiorum 1980 UF-70]EDN97257.1 predicted protein [Sclerotinia sclerotiorum 1980 UF-70]
MTRSGNPTCTRENGLPHETNSSVSTLLRHQAMNLNESLVDSDPSATCLYAFWRLLLFPCSAISLGAKQNYRIRLLARTTRKR